MCCSCLVFPWSFSVILGAVQHSLLFERKANELHSFCIFAHLELFVQCHSKHPQHTSGPIDFNGLKRVSLVR